MISFGDAVSIGDVCLCIRQTGDDLGCAVGLRAHSRFCLTQIFA